MRDFRVYYMGERSVVWDTVHAHGFEILRDGTLVFYENKGSTNRNFAAYREWLRVEET